MLLVHSEPAEGIAWRREGPGLGSSTAVQGLKADALPEIRSDLPMNGMHEAVGLPV
jgi:hypothetical protein